MQENILQANAAQNASHECITIPYMHGLGTEMTCVRLHSHPRPSPYPKPYEPSTEQG